MQPFILEHREVYWDVGSKALFDSNIVGPTNMTHQGLQLEKPTTVEVYISQLTKLYDRHKILIRATALEEKLRVTSNPEQCKQL